MQQAIRRCCSDWKTARWFWPGDRRTKQSEIREKQLREAVLPCTAGFENACTPKRASLQSCSLYADVATQHIGGTLHGPLPTGFCDSCILASITTSATSRLRPK